MNAITHTATDWDMLMDAGKALRKLGFITRFGRGKFACCNSCLAGEINEIVQERHTAFLQGTRKQDQQSSAVWFSRQTLQGGWTFDGQGNILAGHALFICWDTPSKDAGQIVRTLRDAGLNAFQPKDEMTTIIVLPPGVPLDDPAHVDGYFPAEPVGTPRVAQRVAPRFRSVY